MQILTLYQARRTASLNTRTGNGKKNSLFYTAIARFVGRNTIAKRVVKPLPPNVKHDPNKYWLYDLQDRHRPEKPKKKKLKKKSQIKVAGGEVCAT